MITAKQVYKILKIIKLTTGFLVTFLYACSHLKPFIDISPVQADEMIRANRDNPHFVILDVRTADEFNPEHLEGALNLDFKSVNFTVRIDSLDKSATYLLYCRSGGRSAKAMTLMKTKGFPKVYNLQGGITRWKKESRSLQTR